MQNTTNQYRINIGMNRKGPTVQVSTSGKFVVVV